MCVDAKEHCWLLPGVLFAKSPRSFSAGLLWSQAAPACFVCSFCLPRCQYLHFPLLSFRRFLSAHSSRVRQSIWMALPPSPLAVLPPGVVWKLTERAVQQLPRPLAGVSDSTGLQTDTCGAPLVPRSGTAWEALPSEPGSQRLKAQLGYRTWEMVWRAFLSPWHLQGLIGGWAACAWPVCSSVLY